MSQFHQKLYPWMVAGVRILAIGWISWGLFRLVVNFANSWASFDPTYFAHFFWSQVAIPGAAFFVGSLLWIFARLFASLATRNLRE